MLLTLFRGGMPLSYPVTIGLKTLQYLLLAEVTILFCTSDANADLNEAIITGLILLMYFIGKVQNLKFKFMLIQIQGRSLRSPLKPNMAIEFSLVVVAMALFAFLVVNPEFANNQVSAWFYTSIRDIESTPIFGFIFQIVGFFFSLNILFRMFNSISMILSGRAFEKPNQNESKRRDDTDRFDDYEEIN